MPRSMIETHCLSVHYGAVTALRDVSLAVKAGECVLLTGPSGGGKSTFARALTGLIPHTIAAEMDGEVFVAGMDTRAHPVAELAQNIGFVLQNPSSQLFHLRVEDEVAFGPRNLGLSHSEVACRVEWALEAVGLSDLRQCCPSHLSHGQQQRVAIASVLALRPRVLVLDEPLASLDLPATRQVLATLQTLRSRLNMTILLIEHRLAEVAALADRMVVIAGGQIVADDTVYALLSDCHFWQHWGLRRPSGKPKTSWQTRVTRREPPSFAQQPLLELSGVAAGYNHRAVISDLNLALYSGEFAALVGHNGAGKSTVALVAAGLIKPLCGQVRFNGGKRPYPGLDVSILFQNPADQLFTDSVDSEVAFGPLNYRVFDPAWHGQVLSEADLIALRDRLPVTLSVGQQQRTVLAACLALRPRLLILDEPTLGQDWGHLQQLMEFTAQLNRQGTAILLITHDYKLVYRYARRVIVMKDGRITHDGVLQRQPTVKTWEKELSQ
jgi:energy-coupling factor transporter ATP-binding protein EcfA2